MTFQAIRGMHDWLPEQTAKWQQIESVLRGILSRYGFGEIQMPLVEQAGLFSRTIGDNTDIVEKEMYAFEDRNGDLLALRPEGTASCVRAGIEHGLFYNQLQRLWYAGPMFRHERPQKGRYRQFHQLGVEAAGYESAMMDATLIAISRDFWHALGIEKSLRLEINSLGSSETRAKYRDVLIKYWQENKAVLDDDAKRRLESNPLRLLDSKCEAMQPAIAAAPSMQDYLSDQDQAHFADFCAQLDALEIEYIVNPQLVRGLDYYNRTVFEWITDSLGAQGTVCGGGRCDELIEVLGGKPSPLVGFALGIERLMEVVEISGSMAEQESRCIYLCAASNSLLPDVARIRADLMQSSNIADSVIVIVDPKTGAFKKQLKRADKMGANIVVSLAHDETSDVEATIKYMNSDKADEKSTVQAVADNLDWNFLVGNKG